MQDFQLSTNFTISQLHVIDILQKQMEKDFSHYKETQKINKDYIELQKVKVDEQYSKKLRVLHSQQKIKRSAFINKQRLKKSQVMYELCQEIFQEVLVILYRKSHYDSSQQFILISQCSKKLFIQSERQQPIQQFKSLEAEYKYTLIKYILEGTIRMFQNKLKIYTLEKDLSLLKEVIKDCQYCYNSFMEESMGKLGNSFNICYQIVGKKDFLRERPLDFQYLENRKQKRIQEQLQKRMHLQAKSMIHNKSYSSFNSSAKKSSSSIKANSSVKKKQDKYQIKQQIKQYSQDQILQNKQFLQNQDDHCCIGGIILTDQTGNISYNNTFDTRLNILMESCLPLIRSIIWGSFSKF